MNVSDKMNQELERQQAFCGSRDSASKLSCKFINLVHHAILSRSGACELCLAQHRKVKAGPRKIGVIDFDVDKMPGCGLAMRAAIPVGPGGAAGEIRRRKRVAIAPQQGVQRRSSLGCQMPIRDQRRDLMAAVTPSLDLRARQCGDSEQDRARMSQRLRNVSQLPKKNDASFLPVALNGFL
jgi:hypothetical protein